MVSGHYSEARYRVLKEKAAVTIYERAQIGKLWVITFHDTETFANPQDVPLSAFRTILVPLDTTLKAKNPVTRDFVEWHLGQTLNKEDLPFLRFYHEKDKVSKETILSQLVEDEDDYCFLVARVEKPDPAELIIPERFTKFTGRTEATTSENQRHGAQNMTIMAPKKQSPSSKTIDLDDFKGNKTFPSGFKPFSIPLSRDGSLARDVRQPSATPLAFQAHLKDMHTPAKSNPLSNSTPTNNRIPRGPRTRTPRSNNPPNTSQAETRKPPGPRQSLSASIATLEARPHRATTVSNAVSQGAAPPVNTPTKGQRKRPRRKNLPFKLAQKDGIAPEDGTNKEEIQINEPHKVGRQADGTQPDDTQVGETQNYGTQMDATRMNGTYMDEMQADVMQMGGVLAKAMQMEKVQMELEGDRMEGIQMEGVQMEPIRMDGTQTGGTQLNGSQFDGIPTDGLQMDWTQMPLEGTQNHGALINEMHSVFTAAKSQPMCPEIAQRDVQSPQEPTKTDEQGFTSISTGPPVTYQPMFPDIPQPTVAPPAGFVMAAEATWFSGSIEASVTFQSVPQPNVEAPSESVTVTEVVSGSLSAEPSVTPQLVYTEIVQPDVNACSESIKTSEEVLPVNSNPMDPSFTSQPLCPEAPQPDGKAAEDVSASKAIDSSVVSQPVCPEIALLNDKPFSGSFKSPKEVLASNIMDPSVSNFHAFQPEELTEKLLSCSQRTQRTSKELARAQLEATDSSVSSPLSSAPATPRSLDPINPEDAVNEENLFPSIDELEAEIDSMLPARDADEIHLASSFHDAVFSASIQSISQMRLLAATRLKSLLTSLKKYKKTSAKDQIAVFRTQTEALLSMPKQGRVVIGVVGDTGAGKSSLINALLEEEQLVPTSGMKACTAAVTEIKYKESDGYCAEIEFVTWEEWIAELEFVYGLCEDEEWNEAAVNGEELSAVWEKVTAVYPNIRSLADFRSQYKEISNKAEPHLTHTLGQTLSISHHNGKAFNKLVTPYVEMGQHWPLIKSVHISVCSPLLASGAVLVDLPGTHDSNTGRAAVAAKFLQECTHFLVVADIKRAVDNQTAKEILTEDLVGLKLTRDGLEGNVAFVCTQTDLFSRVEIVKGCPEFQPEMDRLTEDIEALKKELESSKLEEKDFEREERHLKLKSRDLEKRRKRWEEVERLVDQGFEKFPVTMSMGSRKRKKASKLKTNDASKRQRRSSPVKPTPLSQYFSDSDLESELSSAPETESECESSPDEDGSPLRAESPKELARILRHVRKELRSVENRIEKLSKTLIKAPSHRKQLQAQIAEAEKALDCACIATRNNFSRSTIKRQFAQGHREQDRANFLAALDAGFDPSMPGTQICENLQTKDYDAIAEAFPVFCISSRGYSQLQGRFKKENWTMPFIEKEQTEIPALKEYIESCTAIPLRNLTLEFMVKLEKLLNAIEVWRSSDEGRAGEGTLDEREQASIAVHDAMELFSKAYESTIDDLAAGMSSLLYENITAVLPNAIASATASCSSIFNTWRRTGSILTKIPGENEPSRRGRKRKEGSKPRGSTGLTWNSFRAHCRLDGNPLPKTKGSAVHMNAELTSLLFTPLESTWANLFTNHLPPCLFACLTRIRKNALEASQAVSANLIPFGLNRTQNHLFSKKMMLHNSRLSTIHSDLLRISANTQRGIFPLLTNVIKRQMSPGYAAAAKCPVGRGMYDTMVSTLQAHLDSLTPTLYPSLTELIKQMLEDLVAETRNRWMAAGKEVWDSMFLHLRNYGVLPVENLRRTRAMERGVAKPPSRVKVEIAKVVAGMSAEVKKVLEMEEDA